MIEFETVEFKFSCKHSEERRDSVRLTLNQNEKYYSSINSKLYTVFLIMLLLLHAAVDIF